MKKADAEAIAIRFLLAQLEQKQIVDAGYHAERCLQNWIEFFEQHISDDVNLDLLKHLID